MGRSILAADRYRFARKADIAIAGTCIDPVGNPEGVSVYGSINGLLDCIVVGILGNIVDGGAELICSNVHSRIEYPRIPVDIRLFRVIPFGISRIHAG